LEKEYERLAPEVHQVPWDPLFQLWTDLAGSTTSVGLGFAPMGETLARRFNPQLSTLGPEKWHMESSRMKNVMIIAISLLVFGGVSSYASEITFDGYAPTGGYVNLYGTPYTSDGYTFTALNTSSDIFDAGWPYYLVGDDTSFLGMGEATVTVTGPPSFELISLQAGPSSLQPMGNLTVTGYLLGGGTESETISPVTTLTTETLDWSGLDEFTLSADSDLGVDNIFVQASSPSPVPEPGTLLLLGTGILALSIMGRRLRYV
jgi:hypothetical protein